MKALKYIGHTLLFTIYPVLFLYSKNTWEVPVDLFFRVLTIVIFFQFILILTLTMLVKDATKLGVILSFATILFFSFGSIALKIPNMEVFGREVTGRHTLLFLELLLGGFITYSLVHSPTKNLKFIVSTLNFSALILVVFALTGVAYDKRLNDRVDVALNTFRQYRTEDFSSFATSELRPDIYYILLDAYARPEVMKEIFDTNAGMEFENALKDMGFFVAPESTTNYIQTVLAVPAALNMSYLDFLVPVVKETGRNRKPLYSLLQDNKVSYYFKNLGYTTVVVNSLASIVDINADMAMPGTRAAKSNDFFYQLLLATPTTFLSELVPDEWTQNRREHVFQTLRLLPEVNDISAPTFTYMHIMIPHTPFIFDENGNTPTDIRGQMLPADGNHYIQYAGEEEYLRGYKGQAIFISREIEKVIRILLEKSSYNAVIIIQSDHGSGFGLNWEDIDKTDIRERMSILNAYYFPDGDYSMLYESITPVNSFCVVFDKFFGIECELKEDKNYFSKWSRPYEFVDVSDRVNNVL